VCPSRGQLYRGGESNPRRGGDARGEAPPPGRRSQPCFICAIRRWLPKGSRSPKSTP